MVRQSSPRVKQDSPKVVRKKSDASTQSTSADISLETLLEVGAHFGHRKQRWNPKIAPYVFGVREGVHIFDLEKTREKLLEAMHYLAEQAQKGSVILLVGTKTQAKDIVRQKAQTIGIPYIADRWIGGLLTNFPQIKKRIDKLQTMQREREAGEYKKFTKKEQLLLDREIARLDRLFGGVTSLTGLPDVLVIIDTKHENTAVREALRMQIPIVAIVDTNSDPSVIDFPIPSNDDSTKAIEYIVGKLGEVISQGLEQRTKSVGEQTVTTVAA